MDDLSFPSFHSVDIEPSGMFKRETISTAPIVHNYMTRGRGEIEVNKSGI